MKVICIDNNGYSNLTQNKAYDLIYGIAHTYFSDDNGLKCIYRSNRDKDLFEEIDDDVYRSLIIENILK